MQTTLTAGLESCIERLRAGNEQAREELLGLASNRLISLARKLKRGFPMVGRWEQTEDIFQIASFRLYEALQSTQIENALHFFRLAARKIRETLIDLARHYQGPLADARHHATVITLAGGDGFMESPLEIAGDMTQNPEALSRWQELHEQIDRLPDAFREMFDLLWYHELTQEQVAELTGLCVRQVRRRWREARLHLADVMGGGCSVFA